MGCCSVCLLGLFLLNSLLCCAHAQVALLTLDPKMTTFFTGQSVKFTCDVKPGAEDEWYYTIHKNSNSFLEYSSYKDYTLLLSSSGYSGQYQCFGYHKTSQATARSNVVSLTVLDKPKARLLPGTTSIQVGETVTLTCSVEGSSGWTYYLFRQNYGALKTSESSGSFRISKGGIYSCSGGKGDPIFYTYQSDEVNISITFSNRVTVNVDTRWSQFFYGETVTVRCDIQGGGDADWVYEWRTPQRTWTSTSKDKYWTVSAFPGDYMCQARSKSDWYSSTNWSENLKMMVSAKPTAQLSTETNEIPAGGSVTLSCSVKSSFGWIYYWYRDGSSEPLNTQDADFQTAGSIRVSKGGVYWCRGGRGDPVYYTEYSHSVNIYNIVPNRAVLTLQPNWTEIFRGERITVRCDIQGGDTEWTYEWRTTSSSKPSNEHEYRISSASTSHSGDYSCRGRMKSSTHDTTNWSNSVKVTVRYNEPGSVLTVSPSWLSPGASVTLKCEVEHSSAGWRFFWYQAVPDGSGSYSYELLPGSRNGTEQDSYIIHGQTHTAGYVCEAGRGDPEFYTQRSQPKFVWSGELRPSASLTVRPDSVQHFIYDPISLTCEGNSTEWKVKMFPDRGVVSRCSSWGMMTKSTCTVKSLRQSADAVYWCESASGEFSNAVNITAGTDIVLVSPVHRVAEGESVTLGCRLKTGSFLSNVLFYKNDKLIQNDSKHELTIPAVSKSHEGFYTCERTQGFADKSLKALTSLASKKSWMSVKSTSESGSYLFPVLLIVGVVCGLLIIVLLLFGHFRKTKGEPRMVRCSSTELKSVPKTSETDKLLYAQLLFIKQGKPPPAPAEKTVYCEVKVETARDQEKTKSVEHMSP